MTDEERQRQMDFILDTLARLTATTDRLAETQAHQDERWAHEEERWAREDERWAREGERNARDRARMARLEASYLMLIELAQRHEERLDQNDVRAANLSAAIADLRRLMSKDGEQG